MKKTLFILSLICFSQCFSQELDFKNDKQIKKLQRKINADLIIPDTINYDAVYLARNMKTKKWGMYQNDEQLIPFQYDSIKLFGSNASFTLVWNNGKVGAILSPWGHGFKESVPCIYDEGKIITFWNREIGQEEKRLKVRKNDKWGMVNWITGDIEIDFIYNSPKDF